MENTGNNGEMQSLIDSKVECENSSVVMLSDYTSTEDSTNQQFDFPPENSKINNKNPLNSQKESRHRTNIKVRNVPTKQVKCKSCEYSYSDNSSASSEYLSPTIQSLSSGSNYSTEENNMKYKLHRSGNFASNYEYTDSLKRYSVCHVLCSNNAINRLTKAAMEIIERENTIAKFLWKFLILIQGDDPLHQNFDPKTLLPHWNLRKFYYIVYELLSYSTELMNRIGEVRVRLLRTYTQKKALALRLIAQKNCEKAPIYNN